VTPATLKESRFIEQQKYVRAYMSPRYGMGIQRYQDACKELNSIADILQFRSWSYLDVGCGRGEMLKIAVALECHPVEGVEVVPALCGGDVRHGEVTRLPYIDNQFDVVTCFDVLEHLPPDDTRKALDELHRVAKYIIVVSANNRKSCLPDGTNLHINIRPYTEWEALLRERWTGYIENRPSNFVSETWRCIKQPIGKD